MGEGVFGVTANELELVAIRKSDMDIIRVKADEWYLKRVEP